MKIQSITPVNYYQNNRLQKSKKNNSISFQGKFLPKGIKVVDLFVAAAISTAAPGLGIGYLATKHILAVNDKNNKQ